MGRYTNPLPHLQFAVLGILGSDRKTGQELRDALRELGVGKGAPAFYRLMGRMEEGGLVEGTYVQEIVDGQIYRQRSYQITAVGRAARDEASRFQLAIIRRFGGILADGNA
ncbi:MAG: PadR family transcriptional regulator [Gemmatimonadota bacterium]